MNQKLETNTSQKVSGVSEDQWNNDLEDLSYDQIILLHRPQLESSGIPAHYWPTLFQKIRNQEFDAGDVFTLVAYNYEAGERGPYEPIRQLQVNSENGVSIEDNQHIYLVDHAWTFRVENARRNLRENEGLRNRMRAALLTSAQEGDKLVEAIFSELWKYCDWYWINNVATVEDRLAIWYMMDEVGLAVSHCEEPNFRIVPFAYIPQQTTYSLMFPIKNVLHEELVTRNFIENVTNKEDRSALLLPWIHKSFIDVDSTLHEPDPEYFCSGRIKESPPDLTLQPFFTVPKPIIKVFSNYRFVNKNLTSTKFAIVDSEDDANVLWYTHHFKDFESLSHNPEKFINQFPNEMVLTVKDLLAVVCRRAKDQSWFPLTYNLKTELTKFVSYFQNQEAKGKDNYWIIKPFNLARGLDTHVTNNINYILRLPATGPKIAQKYITNPVLFYRPECVGKVKFDLRYVILLRSTKPLRVFLYRNFFLRFANKPFELCDFDDYNRHFTVMNYNDDALELKHMLCSEFRENWGDQYPSVPWNGMEEKIFKMIKQVFECATAQPPPCGIAESPQSRAVYAADIMLEWGLDEVWPKLLEINWMPDCKRACDYYPNFYNKVFELLFMDMVDEDLFAAV